MTKLRLAVVSTHPIQYLAPLFKCLADSNRIVPRVFYTWSQTDANTVPDKEFGRSIQWDIPLLEGYDYVFVENVARRPGIDHFWGLSNPTLNAALEAWKPDALLVIAWNTWSHLSVLRHFKGRVRVYFRGDSTLLDRRPFLRTVLRKIALRWIYRHVDAVLAVGSNNIDYYKWCGLRDDQIAYVPHAVDTRRFGERDSHETRALDWRRELRIPSSARVLLFAGKLIPKKDPLGLLRAFVESIESGDPAMHLVYVGDGMLEAQLKAAADGRANVHFLPFQNQQAMPAVYRLGDVYVLPSLGPGETWGLAMNEAAAAGCVVIASDRVGGARDVVEEGRTGWTFKAGDHEALGRRIAEIKALPAEKLAAMKATAAQRSARWSIETAAEAMQVAIAAHRGRS
jgi:glycosyltransferase involved in cell wall biosynthesis